ncbi:MAG: glycosyltransferase, partial [Trebonia sp.]
MKIALVAQHAMTPSNDDTPQAGDGRLLELSRSLASKGHRVTVYAQRHDKTLPERAEVEPGVVVEYLGQCDPRQDLLAQVPAFSRPLHERWRRSRPDVVHALRWTSGLAALAAARGLRLPVVQSFDPLGVTERRHHLMAREASAERIRLEPAIGRSADAVVAGCSDEESDLTRLGVPRRSIRVVPCGVDTGEFTPEGPVAERTGRTLLMTVADLSEHDALATLLRAVSKVPVADLVVIGGPPRARLGDDLNYRRLARLADGLGIRARVTFTGQVGPSALPPLLRSADL